ncbi:MAG: pyridoxamine 5'-phosphate oxidase [Chloroherpetonaceae bacterium]|nr:pyridoxamine 5'-phosphate oxidase [Chloroherpetonaceae bacterium]MDW8437882.1 pyridoxamine 5'-phosphate oxidase [Chloroherpetonaceae bacterium]
MSLSISDLRKDYTLGGLQEGDLDPNPFKQFEKWFQDALEAQKKRDVAFFEANAMTLATATKDGKPSARVVLLKHLDDRGFVFFTNYESRKGQELAENPFAALCFHWELLERQVSVMGRVEKISREESEAYFKTRPLGSRIGAWASKQSAVISGRGELLKRVAEIGLKYPTGDVPLPPFWGGYRVLPDEFQFWQGQPSRLHDRFRYLKQLDGSWKIDRLSP